MLFVVRHGDTPIKRRARNAKVFQSALDEINHLIAARLRLKKIWIVLNVFQDGVGILGHLEEIRLFRNFFNWTMTVGTMPVFVELKFRPIRFAGRAVKPRVFALVDVAFVADAAENFLNNCMMTRLTGTNKIIIGNFHAPPQFLEAVNNFVDVLNRRYVVSLRRALNFLSVLVRTRQEKNFVASKSFKACNGVGNRRAIRVPNVKFCARIINWRRQVVRRFLFLFCQSESLLFCRANNSK